MRVSSRFRVSVGVVLPLALGMFLALVATAPSAALAAEETCPNAILRTGFSAALPDCRAYELVTSKEPEVELDLQAGEPHNIIEGEAAGEARGVWGSVNGDRLAYPSNEPPAGSPSDGIYFMSTRGANGWTTRDLIPPQSTDFTVVCENGYIAAFTPELTSAVLADGFGQSPGDLSTPCGTDEPSLVAGEPQGYQNLFLNDYETGSYQLVDVTPPGVSPWDAVFQDASADLSHVVFSEQAQLAPGAPVAEPYRYLKGFIEGPETPEGDLYEWAGGIVRFVTYLPDGTPVHGSLADGTIQAYREQLVSQNGTATFTHAVSADGSRIFFVAAGDLYVRENAEQEQSPLDGAGNCADPAKGCTVQVDASQAGGPGGGGQFMWASANGSVVFFTDEASAGLTADTVPGSGSNLYRYDLETGALTDLTPAGEAGVEGVGGASEDGSYLYFVAEGDLTGPQENSEGATAEAGQPNLYVVHDAGRPTFIATLSGSDHADWSTTPHFSPAILTARVSPDGEFIGFNSVKSLTGYDNTVVEGGDCGSHDGPPETECQEIYLYEAAQNKLSCVSCNPTGARPTAPAGIEPPTYIEFGNIIGSAPGGSLQRNVLGDGRVFFDTAEGLVPRDTNGMFDVYEYEDGQLHLISTGTNGNNSYFYESSLSGNDVFFLAGQQLPSGSPEPTTSIYDARVDGGFPEPTGLTACGEENCEGAFTPSPAFAPPASATFSGAGNVAPAPTQKAAKHVKRKQKQKKKKKKKKHVAKGKRGKKGGRSSRARRSVRGEHGSVR
jgi:hypothetical protein